MVRPAQEPPSFDELYRQIEALPEGVTGQILVPGQLHTMPRPGKPHRVAARVCDDQLRVRDRRRGGAGWWIEAEAEIRFPNQRLAVPDLSGWRVERVPVMPDENPITVVPDWCAEFLSPSSRRDDRLLKLPMYAQSGVEWIWLVDPEVRSVEVFRAVDGLAAMTVTAADDDQVTLPPFDLPLSLAPWWQP